MLFVARLLIVHHTPSPATAELLDAVVRGASDPDITGVELVRRAALAATAPDLLAADAVVLGTPANIGYMSGALKHFFDTVYYVCVADGMGWTRAAEPVEVMGAPDKAALDACYELGAVVAATVMPG
jgi:multimeric flavodoxin WrbA